MKINFDEFRHQNLIVNEHNFNRYIKFITYCKNNPINSTYTEKHHIFPKSFGGKNNKENIIVLSARQHFLAHYILAKATCHPKMIKALHKIIYSTTGDVKRDYKINNKVYEYVRIKHSKIVSNYSKNTVVAKQIYTGEISRIPSKLFHYYNGILYESLNKGRIDSCETRIKKQNASKKSRSVKQNSRSRILGATLYSYQTPKGFCETRIDLFSLYPTFTKNTLICINKNAIISKKFVSIHKEFINDVGKTFADIGISKINRKNYESKN